MQTLLDIGNEIRELFETIEAAGGDITEHEETIDTWLRSATLKRDEKIDAYAALIAELEARSSVRKAESDRLGVRARVDTNKASFLRERLKTFFEITDLKSVETKRFKVTLARHGGLAPLRISVPPELLPVSFQRVKRSVEPDRDALRAYVEREGNLRGPDGSVLAQIAERGQSIRIS